MAAESVTVSDDAQSNLALLQQRLRRLEFLLTGSSNLDGVPNGLQTPEKSDDTVTAKLARLQAALEHLRRLEGPAGTVVRDIEAICTQAPSG